MNVDMHTDMRYDRIMVITKEKLENTKEFVQKIEKARIELDRLYAIRKAGIIQLFQEGHTIAEIARLFEMQYQNVSKICDPFKEK